MNENQIVFFSVVSNEKNKQNVSRKKNQTNNDDDYKNQK